ncbi:hypothetical protein V8C37DRAFT_388260 [Trichoderma ceciliae]
MSKLLSTLLVLCCLCLFSHLLTSFTVPSYRGNIHVGLGRMPLCLVHKEISRVSHHFISVCRAMPCYALSSPHPYCC